MALGIIQKRLEKKAVEVEMETKGKILNQFR